MKVVVNTLLSGQLTTIYEFLHNKAAQTKTALLEQLKNDEDAKRVNLFLRPDDPVRKRMNQLHGEPKDPARISVKDLLKNFEELKISDQEKVALEVC
jgi:hypothetical protein